MKHECTVASIYPLEIREMKPGQSPDSFFIEACTDPDEPKLLIVGQGIDCMFVGGERGTINFPVPPTEIAKAIVRDLVTSFIFADENIHPGIWWMDGNVPFDKIKGSVEHKAAKTKQMLWFTRLCNQADDHYKSTGKISGITDIQRHAARALGLNREWMTGLDEARTAKCPACRSYVVEDAIVCATCRTILDPVAYKKLNMAAVS